MAGLGHHAVELTGVAGDPASRVHRLDPRAKLLGLFGITAVAVSAPLSAWPVFAACAAVLAGVSAAGRVPPGALWRRGRLVLLPVLLVALTVPFVRDDGLAVLATVAAKATVGIAAAALFTCTTTFPAALRGLEALRAPRLLVLVAALMYRYLFVIAGEASRTRDAMAARAYSPRHALQAGALGRAAGTLFLRSYRRGERVHAAMLARGYEAGRPLPQLAPPVFGRADAAFLVLVAAALIPLRVLV